MGERDVVPIVDMPDAVGIAAMSLAPSPGGWHCRPRAQHFVLKFRLCFLSGWHHIQVLIDG
jgi:hypothetical protein